MGSARLFHPVWQWKQGKNLTYPMVITFKEKGNNPQRALIPLLVKID